MTRELGDELLPCPCHLCGAPVVKDRWGSWSHDDTHDEACFLAGFQLEDADDLHRWNDVREISGPQPQAPASGASDLEGRLQTMAHEIDSDWAADIQEGGNQPRPVNTPHDALMALASARAEIAGLRGVVERLGSIEAFTGARGTGSCWLALTTPAPSSPTRRRPMPDEQSATTHAIERTSPKGGPFIGTCYLCGTENLPPEAVFWPCANPVNLSQDEAVIVAITGGSDAG
jgi:hypothetical protein